MWDSIGPYEIICGTPGKVLKGTCKTNTCRNSPILLGWKWHLNFTPLSPPPVPHNGAVPVGRIPEWFVGHAICTLKTGFAKTAISIVYWRRICPAVILPAREDTEDSSLCNISTAVKAAANTIIAQASSIIFVREQLSWRARQRGTIIGGQKICLWMDHHTWWGGQMKGTIKKESANLIFWKLSHCTSNSAGRMG